MWSSCSGTPCGLSCNTAWTKWSPHDNKVWTSGSHDNSMDYVVPQTQYGLMTTFQLTKWSMTKWSMTKWYMLLCVISPIQDYQLFKVIAEIDEETSNSMVKKYCQKFRKTIGEKLWPYCGSSLAVTETFLTGVDIKAKIEDNKGLSQNVWVGLYKYSKSGPNDLMWHKCQNVTTTSDDIFAELLNSSDYCVSMNKSFHLSPTSCSTSFPYICQIDEGQCWFLPVENKQFKFIQPVNKSVGLNDCAKECRNFVNGTECWGFYVDSSNITCYMYLSAKRHAFITESHLYLEPAINKTVYLKVCVGGEITPMKAVSTKSGNPGMENCTSFKDGESWLDAVCYCDCDQPPVILSPEYLILTPEEKIEKIINELLVDASNTSASYRKLNSIDDQRPSARSIGAVGIIIMCVVFGGLVLLDLNILISHISSLLFNKDRLRSEVIDPVEE
ncbi:hypothetical protein Btru_057075 [Bulinus truncatus]|nr:hypothetical protein Btru_057075 [Bulinus truncatus]